MQTQPQFNLQSMAFLIESAPPLPEHAVAGYRIYRSPIQPKYVNIVAIDQQERMIAVVASDLTISEAQELVSMLNLEFEQQPETL